MLSELESLMTRNGVAIRALPMSERIVVEKRHAEQFPNAEVKFLPEYKREMLVEERQLKHGGEFVLELVKSSRSTVKFDGKRFFKSLDDVAEYLMGLEETDHEAADIL